MWDSGKYFLLAARGALIRPQDLVITMIKEHSPVLRFENLTESDGYIYGGEYMNGIFRDDLQLLLVDHLDEIAQHVSMSPDEVIESFVQGFEKAKRGFSRKWNGPFRVNWVPVARFRPLKEMMIGSEVRIGYDYINLPREFVQNVFDKYLKRLHEPIEKQLDKLAVGNNPGYARISIDLVGGGSRILYVYEAIKELYHDKLSNGFQMRVYRSKEEQVRVPTPCLYRIR